MIWKKAREVREENKYEFYNFDRTRSIRNYICYKLVDILYYIITRLVGLVSVYLITNYYIIPIIKKAIDNVVSRYYDIKPVDNDVNRIRL